jgi:hypothetical protein
MQHCDRGALLTDLPLAPLFVDLDGTLVRTDTLIESIKALVRKRPHKAILLPFYVLKGKAGFKAHIGKAVNLDVSCLPYNRQLLTYLKREHALGRKIILATGADFHLARLISEHANCFSSVIASDGYVNLTGQNKLARIRNLIGNGAFGYIGNSIVDLPLLEQAQHPMLANPSKKLLQAMHARGIVAECIFEDIQ